MRIALLCATNRGLRFLKKLNELRPHADLIVFSFREEPHEPPYMDAIKAATTAAAGTFIESYKVGSLEWRGLWEANPVDLLFAVSWRYMIPREIYELPRFGAYIFHDSLLPAYRGFAPTVWALINGEPQTGVTLFHAAEDVDSGDIVAQQPVPIGADDTIADVMGRVTEAYLSLLEDSLPALLVGAAAATPQDHSAATYTCRRLPEDNRIDWTQSSERIYNLIRAVTRPYPGAFTTLDGARLTIWSASRLPAFPPYVGRIPGRVVEVKRGEGAVVLTGDGALLLREIQPEGGEPVNAAALLKRLSQTLGR
jgi:methionyl-tRNA formyltransferase